MNNDKGRMVLAMVLTAIIFVIWQVYFTPPPVIEESSPVDITQSVPSNGDAAQQLSTSAPQVVGLDASTTQGGTTSLLPIIISKDNLKISFDPATGDVISAEITSYKGENSDVPIFINNTLQGNYMSLSAGVNVLYANDIEEHSNFTKVTFTAETEQIIIKKVYTITNDSYNIPIDFSVYNKTDLALSVPIIAQIGPELGQGFDVGRYVFTGPIMRNEKVTSKKSSKDLKKTLYSESPLWGGYTSKYFLFSVLGGEFEKGEILPYKGLAITKLSKNTTVQPHEEMVLPNLSLYVGPKKYKDLMFYDMHLQRSIEFGKLWFLSIPMNWVLQYVNKFIGNYGLAIIVLTIIIKIITLPLTLKGMMSMRGMSKLQPEIASIREKHKDDPQKLNAATMALYKENGINPLGGCLPMVIQLPIFFALYKCLLVSIELKGAPFFFWIIDLSAKDPLYITPVLMGASMFLQQKLTPSTADPLQQKIFMIMPLVFTILFLSFPSGLVVYWLTNNILTIAQQYVINKKTN